jgi:hypothetical protein
MLGAGVGALMGLMATVKYNATFQPIGWGVNLRLGLHPEQHPL